MLCKISLCLDCVRMLNSRRLTIEGSCIIKFKDYNKWFRLVGAFNSYLQLYMIDTTTNALWIKLEKSRVIVKQFDAILIVLYGSLAHDKCTKLKKKEDENPLYGPEGFNYSIDSQEHNFSYPLSLFTEWTISPTKNDIDSHFISS